MGREIRNVPENWRHPVNDRGENVPQYATTYAEARRDWIAGFCDWYLPGGGFEKKNCDYWEWADDPPERESYSDYGGAPRTWVQMYETVSEGTQVTPPFATKAQLVDHLCECGTYWDPTPWVRANAEQFVESGYAPSLVVTRDETGFKIYRPEDGRPPCQT